MPTPTDVANRALQHCGAERIQPNALFTEDSKNASEIRACYDSTRRAEMRRNIWRFSTRSTALRPLALDSRLITFGTWAIGTSYALNDIVTGSDGQVYMSRVAANVGNNPVTDYTRWGLYFGPMVATEHDADTTYNAGELVYVSSTVYLSLQSSNGETPPSAGYWQTMTTAPTIAAVNIIYPLGAGPVSQDTTKQAYVLPCNYLMVAPQDPKNGAVPVLGWPRGNVYGDWLFEGNYLLSQDNGVIIFRFIADVRDPNEWDPMFFEGFAGRIAMEVCEPITQSSGKLSNIASIYNKAIIEARLVNGIETGPVELPLDSYIECRN